MTEKVIKSRKVKKMKIFPFFVILLYGEDIRAPLDKEKCHVTENMIPLPPDRIQSGLQCTRSNASKKKSQANDYIVGGAETGKGRYPWQVRLSITNESENFICGGSILSDDWVISAAHCCALAKNHKSITVHVGDWNQNSQSTGEFAVVSDQITVHPGINLSPENFYEIH